MGIMTSGNEKCEYCGYEGLTYTDESEGREESCIMCGFHSYEVADEEDADENMFTEPTPENIRVAKIIIKFEDTYYGEQFKDLFLDELYYDYDGYINNIQDGIKEGNNSIVSILFTLLFNKTKAMF